MNIFQKSSHYSKNLTVTINLLTGQVKMLGRLLFLDFLNQL